MNKAISLKSLMYILGPSDGVLISLSKYVENKQLFTYMREKRYSTKEIKSSSSYRVISYWCSKGLIEKDKSNDWLKLNIVDIVWVRIITKLRNFGLNIQAIDKIRKHIFYFSSENNKPVYLLDIYILFAFEKKPVGILINEKFEAVLCFDSQLQDIKKFEQLLSSHIFISLNEIVMSLFTKKNLKPIYNINSIHLNSEEKELLSHLRSGAYEEVKVRLKNGQIVLFEGKKKQDIKTKIIDLIKQSDFQDIEIKLADGKIIKVTQTEKKKFNKG